jgi:hypothetical protein
MKTTLRLHVGILRILAIAAWAASTVAVANHFILPCGGDCATGRWTAAASMSVPRVGHTATLLRTGKVLVAGGHMFAASPSHVLDSAELYDPVTGTWSLTGTMGATRSYHTATMLPDGRVLVTGGLDALRTTATSEIYDPATGAWTLTGAMLTPRYWFDAAALPDGRVLVAGGYGEDILATAELYDPVTGRWAATGSLNRPRLGLTLTSLDDGTVLAVRGSDSDDLGTMIRSAELYDARTGTWTMAGDSGFGSILHTATRLRSGDVLVSGGFGEASGTRYVALTVLYRPTTGEWIRVGDAPVPMNAHAAALLADGQLLLVGGALAARFDPAMDHAYHGVSASYASDGMNWRRGADTLVARRGATLTVLPDETVLLVGGTAIGSQSPPDVLVTAERFLPAESRRAKSPGIVKVPRPISVP